MFRHRIRNWIHFCFHCIDLRVLEVSVGCLFAVMNVAARQTRTGLVRTAHRWTALSRWSMLFSSSNDTEEWIPPNRPLVGDKGQTHLFPRKITFNKPEDLEEEQRSADIDERDDEPLSSVKFQAGLALMAEKPMTATVIPRPTDTVDWLASRRAKLQGLEMMLPDQATTRRQQATDLPVIPGMLLSLRDIEQCMLTLGGLNIKFIKDGPEHRMGGAEGMIFISGTTTNHVKVMSDTLVRQLKKRDLAKRNVNGAMFGAEGSSNGDDDWIIVDCSNYIVHFQLEETRKRYNLEHLWSGKDLLHKLDTQDEDAVEEYIRNNPLPPEIYHKKGRTDMTDLSETMAYLNKSRFNLPHRSVVDRPARRRGNRKPAGRRRFR